MGKTKEFYQRLSEVYHLSSALALLRWDQSVYMPTGAADGRAEQLECLSAIVHRKRTDPNFIDLVDQLSTQEAELSEEERIDVREVKRLLDREKRLPNEFVAKGARIKSESYSAWVSARKNNDFDTIKPFLEQLIDFSREEAELVGYDEHPYDALLDKFEPHERLSNIKPLLANVAEELKTIVPAIIAQQEERPSIPRAAAQQQQYQLCKSVSEALGFSFTTGRLDATAHPFEVHIGRGDLRITTRYEEEDFLSALFCTIHEVGHALYEAGLPHQRLGTPLGSSTSLGIHESQSRFWENLIGRSQAFSKYLHQLLKDIAPKLHSASSPEGLWTALNWVEPSLIRVEADEVTYSLHIFIRTILEEQLLAGDLQVDALPTAWNDLYEEYLGITPPDYKDGVMQDVHWFQGAIGYFPTYVLGNFYGAMFLERIENDYSNLWQDVACGNFTPCAEWLRAQVHQHGKRFRASELVENVVGRPLEIQPFVQYLRNKFQLDG